MEVHVSNTTWLLEFGPASHFFGSGTQDILCWLMNVDRSRGGIDSDSITEIPKPDPPRSESDRQKGKFETSSRHHLGLSAAI